MSSGDDDEGAVAGGGGRGVRREGVRGGADPDDLRAGRGEPARRSTTTSATRSSSTSQAVLEAHRCGVEMRRRVGLPGGRRRPSSSGVFIHHFLSHVLAMHDPDDWRHRPDAPGDAPSDVGLGRPDPRGDPAAVRAAARGSSGGSAPRPTSGKLHALAFSVIGQCLHYKMARPIAERLIGAEAYEALDLDYLTDHITSFCLAALGLVPPLNEAGEPARRSEPRSCRSERRGTRCPGSRSRCWSATGRSSSGSSWA